MRRLWKSGLALTFGLLAGNVRAEGETWRTAQRPVAGTAQPAPAVQLGRPTVELDRPIALPSTPVVDPLVRPTTFRGKAPDVIARPMPVGPAEAKPSLHAWGRAPEINPPEPAGEVAPMPNSVNPPVPHTVGTPMIVSPSGGPVVNGPIWSPDGVCCGSGEVCGDSCGWCGDCCGNGLCGGNRFYVGAEYLLWWMKSAAVPALITQGSNLDAIPGALGQPGTTVLIGDGGMGDQLRSGGRINAGWWLFDDHCLGIDASGFFIGSDDETQSASSFGAPVLARPFRNVTDPMNTFQDAELIAINNPFTGAAILAGTGQVRHENNLWGADINLRSNICCGCNFRLDLLAGGRFVGLDEGLYVTEDLAVVGGPASGSRFLINDSFKTWNRFYGGQVGAIAEYRLGRWVFDARAKIAMGVTQQQVEIGGSTLTTPVGGAPFGAAGGLLALPTNIGRYTSNHFSVVPEFGLTVGYLFTERLRGFVGYNFLYWNNVVRPGDQIDTAINTTLIPSRGQTPTLPPNRPMVLMKDTDFWAQGLTFGLEYRW